MKTIVPSTEAARRLSKGVASMAAMAMILAARNATAGSLLQEYVPLHVGDHYTVLADSATNTVMVEAGLAKYFRIVRARDCLDLRRSNLDEPRLYRVFGH